jgi:hypothetical protein
MAGKHMDGVWQSWPCVGFMPHPLPGHGVANVSDPGQGPRSSVCLVIVLSGFVGLAGGCSSCLLSPRRPRAGSLARTFPACSDGFVVVASAMSRVGNLGCRCDSLGRWTTQVTQCTVWAIGENFCLGLNDSDAARAVTLLGASWWSSGPPKSRSSVTSLVFHVLSCLTVIRFVIEFSHHFVSVQPWALFINHCLSVRPWALFIK